MWCELRYTNLGSKFCLSAQNVLLGTITPNIRQIWIGLIDRTIQFVVILMVKYPKMMKTICLALVQNFLLALLAIFSLTNNLFPSPLQIDMNDLMKITSVFMQERSKR